MTKLLSVLFLFNFSQAEVIDRVVAVVNETVITLSDVEASKRRLRSNGLVDEFLLDVYDRSKLVKDDGYLIDFLIDEGTIDSEVKLQGIVSPIEQVESEIRNIAQSRGIDRNQLKMTLKNEGVAYSDYQDFIKTSLQRQTLLQREVISKIKISDEEVNAYYVANFPTAKALVYEYSLAHILFLNSNGGADAAQKRADEVSTKLSKGIPFETLAAQYSEDPQFSQGGIFGTFRASDFNKDIAKAISSLAAGDISTVVKMPDGSRIFKVLKKTLVPSPDLEKRREEIRRKLTSEGFKRQFHAWINQKRRESYIRKNQI